MKKRLLLALRLGASLLLVVLLLRQIDIDQAWYPVDPAGWGWLLLAALLLNGDRVLMAYKWRLLLKPQGVTISLPAAVRSYFIGTYWGIFLPGTVGGDVVRACCVVRQEQGLEAVVSSIVLERILGTITSLLIAVVCVVLAVTVAGVVDWRLAVLAGVLSLLGMGALALSMQGRWHDWLERHPRVQGSRALGKLVRCYRAYQVYRHHRAVMLRFVAWTVLEQCVPIVCVYLTALALRLPVTFMSVVIFTPLIISFAKIPISLDGFGVREGLYVYCFALVGLPRGDAFLLGLVSHVIGNLALLPGFLYSWLVPAPTPGLPPDAAPARGTRLP